MVEASPSALFDSTDQVACGLPSMIQDGSIGRGVKSTVVLAISIRARDIENLKQSEAFAGGGLQSSGRNLSFPYELIEKPPHLRAAIGILPQSVATHAHSPLRKTGTRRPSAWTPSISVWSEPIIQSMWIRLALPPCAAICCGESFAPSTKHFE